jgi:hypothetical protein
MPKQADGVDMIAELLLELRRVQIEIADWNERLGYSTADHDIMARGMLARWRSIKALLEKYEPKG